MASDDGPLGSSATPTEEKDVDVRIGVTQAPRELNLELAETPTVTR